MSQSGIPVTDWSTEEKEKYADIIRKLSEHEDMLQNARFSWFATLQGFLFAALAVVWKDGTDVFIYINCFLGALVAASCANAIELCSTAQINLQEWWNTNLPDYRGPSRVGLYVGRRMTFRRLMRPWRIIPRVFIFAWLAISIHRIWLTTHKQDKLDASYGIKIIK